MTFINSHLAAFDEMVGKRNADFHDISKRLEFPTDTPVVQVAGGAAPLPGAVLMTNTYESDVLFWMGGMPCFFWATAS